MQFGWRPLRPAQTKTAVTRARARAWRVGLVVSCVWSALGSWLQLVQLVAIGRWTASRTGVGRLLACARIVVRNAVSNGLQADARSGFTRADRSRRINEYAGRLGLPNPPPQAVVSTLFQLPSCCSGPTSGAIVKRPAHPRWWTSPPDQRTHPAASVHSSRRQVFLLSRRWLNPGTRLAVEQCDTTACGGRLGRPATAYSLSPGPIARVNPLRASA